MKIEDIEKIVQLMETTGLSEFQLEKGDLKLSLKRQLTTSLEKVGTVVETNVIPSTKLETPTVAEHSKAENGVHYIKSPMVGTFYSAPSPDSDKFVKIGDKVNQESVVCILEAMKIMNEIHAECTGEIVDILVDNGQSVEYGQPLFKVKL